MFSALAGQARNGFGRFTPDGALDSFDPGHGAEFDCWAMAADGALLIADTIGDLPDVMGEISRYYPDGTQDTNFIVTATSSTFNPYIASLLVQPDGQFVIGGLFNMLAGQSCLNLSRLQPDGMPDTSFYQCTDNMIGALALQPDGGILLGGDFTSVAGQPRNHIARLNADGSLDWLFDPGTDAQVSAFAVQANGKIIVGGDFSTINGEPRRYLARLNPDGTLDPLFNPAPDFYINTIAIQADGATAAALRSGAQPSIYPPTAALGLILALAQESLAAGKQPTSSRSPTWLVPPYSAPVVLCPQVAATPQDGSSRQTS